LNRQGRARLILGKRGRHCEEETLNYSIRRVTVVAIGVAAVIEVAIVDVQRKASGRWKQRGVAVMGGSGRAIAGRGRGDSWVWLRVAARLEEEQRVKALWLEKGPVDFAV
jgi:hypothetical protein